jgi:hypothetical protein
MCQNCGTQYADSDTPPTSCKICSDERQYVGWGGQKWMTHEELGQRRQARIEMDGDLLGIGITPSFAIPQRSLFVPTNDGNFLWECTSLVTPEAVAALQERGGVDMIVISHPHFYSVMIEWSDALGGVPILLHEADKAWVSRSFAHLKFWTGDVHKLAPSINLYRCPGHFPGSTVLHWKNGPKGKDVLLSGDALHVVQDRRHVSFMYSVPNYIPSHPDCVREIQHRLEGLNIDDVYGFTWGLNILGGGRAAIDASFERYFAAISPVGTTTKK